MNESEIIIFDPLGELLKLEKEIKDAEAKGES